MKTAAARAMVGHVARQARRCSNRGRRLRRHRYYDSAHWGSHGVDAFTWAGIVEAVLCQTPSQVIGIKLIHDQSPRGPKQVRVRAS